uniref:Uncharacterized protein n=1 Tax=Parastrongyloides trichosuri TaxID=131310 RepID=A0A0N4ZZW5_PARTI
MKYLFLLVCVFFIQTISGFFFDRNVDHGTESLRRVKRQYVGGYGYYAYPYYGHYVVPSYQVYGYPAYGYPYHH